MSSKRDAIRAAKDIKTIVIDVPEWGMTVSVVGMTGAERDAYEASLVVGRGADMDVNMANARAKLAVICCRDDDGSRLFDESDVAWLADKSAIALDRLFAVAQRLSGLTKSDIESLAKNSESAPSASSHIG